MWRSHKKLAAYTLVELIIVMALAGVLSTAVYGMFFWIVKQYQGFDVRRLKIDQVMEFNTELERLFFEASRIEAGTNKQLFFILPEQEILLEFEEEYVLRVVPGRIDTLNVSANLKQVYELDIQGKQRLVQWAEISVLIGEEQVQRVFRKHYGAKSLMPALLINPN